MVYALQFRATGKKCLISDIRDRGKKKVELTFVTEEPINMHPQKGIPQLFFHTIEDEIDTIRFLSSDDPPPKLTRRILQQVEDWADWLKSEALQLALYDQQIMFEPPVPRPPGANVLNLLWTYLIKPCGRKKARCVCNGAPNLKGSVTLANTYAACLEQPAQRIFWGTVAIENLIAVGADASNAFAEAPPPVAHLYVTVDKPFREWWITLKRPEIPKGYVLQVQHALQGHPESPKLWADFIDDIIRTKVGLIPTTHEPYLYRGEVNGNRVVFLRQVDDFAVASSDEYTCDVVIQEISRHLTAPMKNLGVIDRFNGLQIQQTQDYIKLHNSDYVRKIIKKHNWDKETPAPNDPVPMRYDSTYLHQLETTIGPTDPKSRNELEERMKFSYRQALGEILFAMITCRPDISFATIKLSQYANSPAEIHYTALKNVFRYLRNTVDDGLYFWRTMKLDRFDLPNIPAPDHYHVTDYHQDNERVPDNVAQSYVDSDWASDTSHRRSFSGMIVMYAGAVVSYKTRLQPTVALSSTEAEFVAACDSGKTILYIRSLLDELGIEQVHATTMYEDNQGALLMANARQPTRRTRHVEIKHFALLDWVGRDLVILKNVDTSENCADPLTKATGKNVFYRHFDKLVGRKQPHYVDLNSSF